MAYTQLPTRTTADANAAGDINQLQDNFDAVLGGAAPFDEVGSPGTPATDKRYLYFKSDGKLYKKDDAGVETEIGAGGGGGIVDYCFKPVDWFYPSTAPAPLDTDSGTNGTIKRHLFDEVTREYLESVIVLPSTLNAGNVTFEAYVYANTVPTGADVAAFLDFEHSAKASGEVWDAAYATAVSSGSITIPGDGGTGVAKQIILASFTETIANLGWSASDQVRIKLSRDVDAADTLTGELGLTYFRIVLP